MDADGDYIPKSVLNGNVRSIAAWAAWKQVKYIGKSKVKSLLLEKGIHGAADIPAHNLGQHRTV
jgi:hypothetical protein